MITVKFKLLDLPEGVRILDIGCGSGRHLGAAGHLPDVRLYGLDPCREDLCQAQSRLEAHHGFGLCKEGCWSLIEGDATRLPYEDNAFDLVILSEVLEHLHQDRLAVEEALRVAKPNAHLVVSVPRAWPERLCWKLDPGYGHAPGGHIRIYERHRLLQQIQNAGGRLWHQHGAHALHSPYWWCKCLKGADQPEGGLLRLYHRLLVWDMMRKPRLTQGLEKLLNPWLGKSEVFYFTKKDASLAPLGTEDPV